jgi:hypothetical protein
MSVQKYDKKMYSCWDMSNGGKKICSLVKKEYDNYYNPALTCPIIYQNEERKEHNKNNKIVVINSGKKGPSDPFLKNTNIMQKIVSGRHNTCAFDINKDISGLNFGDANGFYHK